MHGHGRYFLLLLWAGCLGSSPSGVLFQEPDWHRGATEGAPQLDTEELAWVIHLKVNDLRQDHGLTALAWAEDLKHLALDHSRDMAEHPFFGHTNPRGLAPTDRACDAGLCPPVSDNLFALEGVGENLFLTHRYAAYYIIEAPDGSRSFAFEWKSLEDLAEEAISLWVASTTHRMNLLRPLYRSAGIGIVRTDHETLFVTQNLSAQTPEKLASL